MRLRLSPLVALAMLLEGCVNLYFTYGVSVMFRYAHASWAQTLRATSGPLTYSLVYVIAAALYRRITPSRPWLRILAIVGAVYASYFLLSYRSFVSSYTSFFHGDIVAISEIASIGMVVVGGLAAVDHYAGKAQRRHFQ